MTFTYVPIDMSDRDRVRFHIADTVENNGPLPDDGNFQDEELDPILDAEGSWPRAVAACFERLTAEWRKYPNLEADQFGLSRSHISNGFAQDAKRWRDEYGYALAPHLRTRAFSVGFIRADGFGDDSLVGAPDDQ